MSLNWIFYKLFFKKYKPNEVVTSKEDKAFRKLTLSVERDPPPIIGVEPDHFDLRILGLKSGTHILTVTSVAGRLQVAESDHSEPIEYTVE